MLTIWILASIASIILYIAALQLDSYLELKYMQKMATRRLLNQIANI